VIKPQKNKKLKFSVEKEKELIPIKPVLEDLDLDNSFNFPALNQKTLNIIETTPNLSKKTIRRSGLEIKEAEELQEKKKMAQEKEWEIPAFLRKVKFKG
jgi:hypothetical protein